VLSLTFDMAISIRATEPMEIGFALIDPPPSRRSLAARAEHRARIDGGCSGRCVVRATSSSVCRAREHVTGVGGDDRRIEGRALERDAARVAGSGRPSRTAAHRSVARLLHADAWGWRAEAVQPRFVRSVTLAKDAKRRRPVRSSAVARPRLAASWASTISAWSTSARAAYLAGSASGVRAVLRHRLGSRSVTRRCPGCTRAG
jgi:hypothetical protein